MQALLQTLAADSSSQLAADAQALLAEIDHGSAPPVRPCDLDHAALAAEAKAKQISGAVCPGCGAKVS